MSYRYYLSITSQLPFCGIPFRLDAYSACQFSCRYCFAADRGGAFGGAKVSEANPRALGKRLKRLLERPPASAIDEMLAARIPLHFGGMSDPFMPLEKKRGTSLALLEVLAEHQYPTILSTKGVLLAGRQYLDVLSRGRFAVQFSFSTASDVAAAVMEPGVPAPTQRLRAVEAVTGAGVNAAIRLQPYLPLRLRDAYRLLDLSSRAGARHFAVEHLKLPIERDATRRARLNAAAGYDLGEYYAKCGAQRVGREWVLPSSKRLPAIKRLGALTRQFGMSFGAADSDLLHLSDGTVCCSGADILGMGRGLEFNFLTAVRRGMNSGTITFGSIAKEWRPTGSISKFINSNSRSAGTNTVEKYIRDRWNGVPNGPSPRSFFGVEATSEFDENGYRIYRYRQ